jgi:galactokinase
MPASLGEINERFTRLSGGVPEGIWRSPGRVNLIGEHTDYNEGLSLPFAIDRATIVMARRRLGKTVRIWSANLGREVTAALDAAGRWKPGQFEGWARYPLGVMSALLQKGAEIPGLDLLISSDIPLGSGLSSSAALTVGVAVMLNDLVGAGLGRRELALVSQHAESAFAGVPCGLLDQMAVLEGKAGHAVMIDFASMTTALVRMPAEPVVIIDTKVERTNASGVYADRRAACERAALRLGLASLRQADLAQVENQLEGNLRKRARHVVTENARVRETALRLRDNGPIGDLLVGSHISLREDYGVSCPELDQAVETALANGAEGARLTGAGLGGCAIALGAAASGLAEPLAKAFAAAGFRRPKVFEVTPSDGAGRLE